MWQLYLGEHNAVLGAGGFGGSSCPSCALVPLGDGRVEMDGEAGDTPGWDEQFNEP